MACGSPKERGSTTGCSTSWSSSRLSKPQLLRTYPKLFKGTHVTHPAYEHHHARTVTVAAPGIMSYADGERFGALPLTIEAAPGALRVLV